MGRKGRKKSLFDDVGGEDDSQFADMFDASPKTKLMKIDLLAPPEIETKPQSKAVVATVAEVRHDEGSNEDRSFDFVEESTMPETVEALKEQVKIRLTTIERTIRRLQSVGSSGLRLHAVDIPDDVLMSSVRGLIAEVRQKRELLAHKELLIECLRECVGSTFERDSLIRRLNEERLTQESAAAEYSQAEGATEELREVVRQRRGELDALCAAIEARGAALREEVDRGKCAELAAIYEARDPWAARLKVAREAKADVDKQMEACNAEHSLLGGSVDPAVVAEIAELKRESVRAAGRKIREFVDALAIPLETAFNPLREYKGVKVLAAARTLLGNQAKKM